MNQGQVVQTGTPREIYLQPANRYVASFVGKSNYVAHGNQLVLIRPEDIHLSADSNGDFVIEQATFMGSHTLYRISNGTQTLCVDLFGREGNGFCPGDRVHAMWDISH